MNHRILKLRIFLSSPGDVAAERKIAREILEGLNDDPFIKNEAVIEVIAWEAPSSRVLMPVTLTPQEAIDRNLAKPSETDATIVLLWGRMGTPLSIEKHGTKPNGEPYWSGTEWEYLDAMQGAKEHSKHLPIVLLYRRTDDTLSPQQKDFPNVKQYLGALEQYAVQLGRVEEFFQEFRGEDGSYLGNVNEYSSPEDFRTQFTQDARLLLRELLAIHNETTAPDPKDEEIEDVRINWEGSPFPGLRAFKEKDEPIFFGRGYETSDLIKRLSNQRLMFVVGASGSGKSSLVGAGVLPHLQRGALFGVAAWYIARFTPADAPFKQLSHALLNNVPALDDPLADDEERAEKLSELFQKAPDKLAKQVEKWLRDEPEGCEIFLFIDQFEELFTTSPEDERQAFAEMLQVLSPQIRIILTMRSDFYDQALRYFETTLRDASYTLSTPSAYALREMIERPAQVTGLSLETGLSDLIVEKTIGQVGGLALVAYLLEELYLLSKKRGNGQLSHADYQELGGVERAIATRAHHIYQELDIPVERKRAALQRVFSELIEPTIRDGEVVATRRRANEAMLLVHEDVRLFIDAFKEARLLVSDEGLLEVAHEALLREWDELSNWIGTIADDLRLLRQIEREANDWHTGGRSYLLSAERLKPIHDAMVRLDYEARGVVQDFVYPQKMMLDELEKSETTEQRRLRIGDDLALLGDPRAGVGVEGGLPDIAWLPVVQGGDIQIKGKHFTVKPFYISKYLVTYAQYQAFVTAEDGFNNRDWWRGFPEKYQPQKLNEQRTKSPNNPRDSISWYQSVAFSRWLDAKYREKGVFEQILGGLNPDDWQIRIPTEWEWQWVAQNGREEREYPWGEWQRGFADTNESGLGRAIAVGMYPHGAANCGAMDIAGNLYEWCANNRYEPEIIDVTNKSSKALRGGSFNSPKSDVRDHNASYIDYHIYGCRLILSSLSHL